jgi:hypothetical protein
MVSPINDGLLGEGGIELIGSQLPLKDLILAARKRYKWMPFCVVEDWVMLDAILTDEEQSKVAAAGCQPMFVFAHKVVHYEQRRFEPGDWVRSTIARTLRTLSLRNKCFGLRLALSVVYKFRRLAR